MNDEPPSPDLIVEAGWAALDLDLAALVQRAAAATFAAVPALAGRPDVEVAVRLTDAATIRSLNATWRGQDRPTDVLSFPATDAAAALPAHGPLLLGDVVVALETSAADAAELDRPLADHLTHLVVHGLLHLVHHDHETATAARAMEALEVRILAGLGLPDPYEGRPLMEEMR